MKSQKTNRLQNYELSALRSLINSLENKLSSDYLNFSKIYTGEKFLYPTNEEEADIFIKDRIRLPISQDANDLLQRIKKILLTDFDLLA